MKNKEFDFVVFGASSFVGKILTAYLVRQYGTDSKIKWAIAGRSMDKLEALKVELNAPWLTTLKIDASSEVDLKALCEQTRAIASTVGPYALYGSGVVQACAQSGVDYCDLTGEVQWIARMIAAYEEDAKRTGAKIVHCCGFDSIPSDLGVQFLQEQAVSKFDTPCQQIKMRVRRLKGEFSGGTLASLINVAHELSKDRSLAKKMSNPYFICPDQLPTRQPNVKFAEFDPTAQSWLAPFVMAGINTRVVHRSNALLNYAYGKEFKYDEAMMTGNGGKGRLMATTMALGMGAFLAGVVIPPTRWALERFVIPKPGEGPSRKAQETGHYDLRFYGQTASGKQIQAKVTGDRDPGYGSTGKMLGEAIVCLSMDMKDKAGGFWTPASLMGSKLRTRLEKHAGLSFEIIA